MCTTNVYTYVHPDGRKQVVEQPTLCHKSRHGRTCGDNVLFRHPSQFVGAASAPPTTSYMGSQLPPTPTYTPRSSTPNYRSGDESDRSHHSGSSSRSKRRSSSIYVGVNGQPIIDTARHERRHSSRDRVLIVDSPPTTPPMTYTSHAAPSSPHMPYIVHLVDTPPTSSRHIRQTSTSSHGSHHSRRSSHTSYTDEEDREQQRRRERRREERRLAEEELHEQNLRARIAKANREIANRPAAPMPPPPPRRSASFVARPAVEVSDGTDAELAEAVRRLRIEKEARRLAAQEDREEKAQRERLRQRLQPKRHSSKTKTRVLYDDGTYRYE